MVGGGIEWDEAAGFDNIYATVDGQLICKSGLSIYGALLEDYADWSDNSNSPPQSTLNQHAAGSYPNFGLILQVGYRLSPQVEPFVRYDVAVLNSRYAAILAFGNNEPGGQARATANNHEFTAGVNYYLFGYRARSAATSASCPTARQSTPRAWAYWPIRIIQNGSDVCNSNWRSDGVLDYFSPRSAGDLRRFRCRPSPRCSAWPCRLPPSLPHQLRRRNPRAARPCKKDSWRVQARIDELSARQQASQARNDAVMSQIRADADQHSQLMSVGFTPTGNTFAGYDPETGFFLQSDDGNFSIHPGLLLQSRYDVNYRNQILPGHGGITDKQGDDTQTGFEITRFRLSLDGNVFSQLLTYYVQLAQDASMAHATLLDAYAMYRISAIPAGDKNRSIQRSRLA